MIWQLFSLWKWSNFSKVMFLGPFCDKSVCKRVTLRSLGNFQSYVGRYAQTILSCHSYAVYVCSQSTLSIIEHFLERFCWKLKNPICKFVSMSILFRVVFFNFKTWMDPILLAFYGPWKIVYCISLPFLSQRIKII